MKTIVCFMLACMMFASAEINPFARLGAFTKSMSIYSLLKGDLAETSRELTSDSSDANGEMILSHHSGEEFLTRSLDSDSSDNGEMILHSGEMILHSGEEALSRNLDSDSSDNGEMILHSGEMVLHSGEMVLHSGEMVLHSGEMILHSGEEDLSRNLDNDSSDDEDDELSFRSLSEEESFSSDSSDNGEFAWGYSGEVDFNGENGEFVWGHYHQSEEEDFNGENGEFAWGHLHQSEEEGFDSDDSDNGEFVWRHLHQSEEESLTRTLDSDDSDDGEMVLRTLSGEESDDSSDEQFDLKKLLVLSHHDNEFTLMAGQPDEIFDGDDDGHGIRVLSGEDDSDWDFKMNKVMGLKMVVA